MPRNHRYEFHHRGLEIDLSRLVEVIADADASMAALDGARANLLAVGATQAAMAAAGLSAPGATSADVHGNGLLGRLYAEDQAAAETRDRMRDARRWTEQAESAFHTARAERRKRIAELHAHQAAEQSRLIGVVETARRCCRYASERGVSVPGMTRYLPAERFPTLVGGSQ